MPNESTFAEQQPVAADQAAARSTPPTRPLSRAALGTALPAVLLGACGGGSGNSGGSTTPPPATPITDQQAARFLAQASMGATRAHISRVKTVGFEAWLDEQMALPADTSRWDWLLTAGFGAATNMNSQAGFDAAMWRKLIAAPDTLRQRITLALSECLVVGIDGLNNGGWRAFTAAGYADLLEANAFGNYRSLLQQVSSSPAMAIYLTFRGNTKANATRGSLPDENYARELLQLFTIGLTELNIDGSPKLTGGAARDSYAQADITGLARVFTGWDWDRSTSTADNPQQFQRQPLVQVATRYETGAKTFLGSTIAAGTEATACLAQALDIIFAHANLAPFVSRQLIQRLVTSNPSAAYVGRVASAFKQSQGDMKVLIKAVLLDDEARNDAGLANPQFGKLREPILRFAAWARAFNASSPSNAWAIPNTTDPGTRLGQAPGRSASVFNFFRPGYVPPNSAIGAQALVAPEFQITNESSVVGYINFMQRAVSGLGIGDVRADYGSLLPLVPDTAALLNELNTVLAAGQLSEATLALLKGALDSIAVTTDTGKNNRLYAALTLVLASPEFIAQK
jgi:uncharacterized protein (DUF1800 family)